MDTDMHNHPIAHISNVVCISYPRRYTNGKRRSSEINQNNMSRYQWFVILICICLNIIDGFDVMVMAFTAPSVSAEWSLSGAQIGLLLSAGLFGMAAGSIFLAPLADKIGRRLLILVCLVIAGLSMLGCALVQSHGMLAALRFITGIGVGGILASSNVLASEYANALAQSRSELNVYRLWHWCDTGRSTLTGFN